MKKSEQIIYPVPSFTPIHTKRDTNTLTNITNSLGFGKTAGCVYSHKTQRGRCLTSWTTTVPLWAAFTLVFICIHEEGFKWAWGFSKALTAWVSCWMLLYLCRIQLISETVKPQSGPIKRSVSGVFIQSSVFKNSCLCSCKNHRAEEESYLIAKATFKWF